ncbi:hypothetical protein R4E38_15005 [Morganella morganii]|uniref:Uncharacterized protein n=3 Tax=Morganella TaxID=581 RepID=M1SR73_MORMO|nr:hypothetical protein [Morganella morganii]AGG29602.1 hypothetical protein MU9_556 [Morganella morganii subsp. morganii KT]AZP27254.1 hypothetical protein D8758_18040 [Morganella morganii]EJK8624101.1 hypothetical protein [Morganella morganii]EKW5729156.1 hypothetical protein [Morganella morganii]ELW9227469.1 hypothetical protein [Morganella morganii]
MKNKFNIFILTSRPFLIKSRFLKILFLYIRKNYLESELSNRLKTKQIRLSSIKLLSSFVKLIKNSKVDIYFKLNRVNLSDIENMNTYSFNEYENHSSFRDLAYLLRTLFSIFLLPVSAFIFILLCLLFKSKLSGSDFKSLALAMGDILFVAIIKKLISRNKNNIRIYFSAAIIPDAAIFISTGDIIEVSHGVIHPQHPTYYFLEKRTMPIVVGTQQQKQQVINNGVSENIIILSDLFFRSYFHFNPDAPKVFIGQFGFSFEETASEFLDENTDILIRFHPRCSDDFRCKYANREYKGNLASYLYSISSSMLLDAQLAGIPYSFVYSKNKSFENEFLFSRNGLL